MPEPQESKKNVLQRLKEGMDSKEEQLDVLSTFIRLGILIWSGAILTLNYVTIPKLPQHKIDPTFIASVFTGTLATFGVQASKDNHAKGSASSESTQIIRIEQKPIKIITDDGEGEET